MNQLNKYILFFLFLTLCTAATSREAEKKKHSSEKALETDGPYLLYTPNNELRSITVDKKGKITDKIVPAKDYSFNVSSQNGKHQFAVKLHPIERPQWKYNQPEKVVVISDPHGNMDCFVSILQANKVINEKYEWAFGKNHLVIIGDVFDRGNDVLPIFWLIYKLEKEAADAGGQLSFLLGNHEPMELIGDARYAKKKYLNLAKALNVPYTELWNKDTELGRWLAVRNTIQTIGDNLFVHAGLSSELYKWNKTIPEINETASLGLFSKKAERKAISPFTYFVHATYGPLWYRGLVKSEDKYNPISSDTLNLLLDKYRAKRIYVGHTIFNEVTTFYKRRVIAVNVDNKDNRKEGRSRGVLIKNDSVFTIFDSGKDKFFFKTSH